MNLASGELQYLDPTSTPPKPNYATYAGTATVAQVYCTTCHAVTNANDPHVTGIPWTPGSFPLQVSPDGGSIFLEKSPEAAAVIGTNAGYYGPGDTCMWCHRSRVDVTNYITASNKITSVYWGPHEGPQADIFTGAGRLPVPGADLRHVDSPAEAVVRRLPHARRGDNQDVPDHSFNPQLSACLVGCHTPAPTTFNIAGGESVVKGAMTDLERALNNQGWLTRAASAPYTPLTDPDAGGGNWATGTGTEDTPLPGPTLTAAQAGALYNYILVARGGAYGVHNPLYEEQLLYDSYVAVTGNAPPAFPSGRP